MITCGKISLFGQGELLKTTLAHLYGLNLPDEITQPGSPRLLLYISDKPGEVGSSEQIALSDELASGAFEWFLRVVRLNQHSIAIGPLLLSPHSTRCLVCLDHWVASRYVTREANDEPPASQELELELLGLVTVQQALRLYAAQQPTLSYLAKIVTFDAHNLRLEKVSITSLPWCQVCTPAETFSQAVWQKTVG